MRAALMVSQTEQDAWRGLRQVLRIHASLYMAVFVGSACAVAGLIRFDVPRLFALPVSVGVAAVLFWMLMSLFVAHWVYDASDARRGVWLEALLPHAPARWVNIHNGLDDSSEMLKRIYPRRCAGVFDIYDPVEMTEGSIARARVLFPPAHACNPAHADALPLSDESCDLVLLAFVAHELRKPASRDAFFAELRRILRPGGCIALVEHFRGPAVWIAFGPNAPHFYTRSEWLRVASKAGLTVHAQQPITPFAGVLILRRPL